MGKWKGVFAVGSLWAMAAGCAIAAEPDINRPTPFYGLYCWASDFQHQLYRGPINEVGFKLIGSMLNAGEEKGMLLAAQDGVETAGIVGFNSYGRTMDLDGWRKRVQEAVARYGYGGSLWKDNPKVPPMPVRYWIIWGEPGTALKPPGDMMPDEAYAKGLKVAHEVIKAANKDYKIVGMSPIGSFGSLPSPTYSSKERKIMGAYAFIEGVHKHGGAAWYDCIDIHPFSMPLPSDTAGLAKMLKWLKAECKKYGREKPIWLTEIGFALSYGPTKPFHVTKDQAADYMVRCLAICARHGVQTLTLTYVNDQFSGRDNRSWFLYKAYGFFKNGKLRPIAKATKLMKDLIPEPPQLLEVISDGENVSPAPVKSSDRPYKDSPFHCYKFKGRNDSQVWVVWTEGRPFYYMLKVGVDKVALYNRELLGGIVYSKASGSINDAGEMKIPVSGLPLLISTEVSKEQEEATKQYLGPTDYKKWKPIRGAED